VINYLDQAEMMKSYHAEKCISYEELCRLYSTFKVDRMPAETQVILLAPQETILAHTEEYIGGKSRVDTKMFCRSSYGRLGISVCKCAGLGDVGYYNRWTMEITNHNRDMSVPLFVGQRIAQIAFYEVGPTEKLYKGYQDSEEPWLTWKPENMLPRLYKTIS